MIVNELPGAVRNEAQLQAPGVTTKERVMLCNLERALIGKRCGLGGERLDVIDLRFDLNVAGHFSRRPAMGTDAAGRARWSRCSKRSAPNLSDEILPETSMRLFFDQREAGAFVDAACGVQDVIGA